MMHAHIGYTPSDISLWFLQSALSDRVHLTWGDTPPPDGYDVLVSGRPAPELIEDNDRLHTLIIPFAGLPPTTAHLMRQHPHIAVYNLHHNAPPTAEMALTLLMAAAKQIVPADQALRQGDWSTRYDNLPAVQLRDKTALILGYGAVGAYLGDILRALGMRVMGIRRRHHDTENDIYPPSRLHELLPQVQVLISCLPGTEETTGMVGAEELASLPRGAIVVNVGRGAVIDQYALYDALKSGHLHAAGSDVWYTYPPTASDRTSTRPADAPLWELDNMVLSPHRGGGGGNDDVERLRMEALAHTLNLLATGQHVPHRIDLDLGY